jgi:hypothetical protein
MGSAHSFLAEQGGGVDSGGVQGHEVRGSGIPPLSSLEKRGRVSFDTRERSQEASVSTSQEASQQGAGCAPWQRVDAGGTTRSPC